MRVLPQLGLEYGYDPYNSLDIILTAHVNDVLQQTLEETLELEPTVASFPVSMDDIWTRHAAHSLNLLTAISERLDVLVFKNGARRPTGMTDAEVRHLGQHGYVVCIREHPKPNHPPCIDVFFLDGKSMMLDGSDPLTRDLLTGLNNLS